MKGYNGWSYAPYRPYFFDGGDINQTLAQYETTYQKMIDDANIMLR